MQRRIHVKLEINHDKSVHFTVWLCRLQELNCDNCAGSLWMYAETVILWFSKHKTAEMWVTLSAI